MSATNRSSERQRESVREFFTDEAETWEEYYRQPETLENHDYRRRSEAALDWLSSLPLESRGRAPRLLELGCGAGVQAQVAAKLGWKVTGVDLSVEMLRRAGTAPGVSALSAGAEQLPFRDARFDAVIALGLIGYVAEPERALREIRSTLRAGGRLLISFYSEPPYLLDALSDAVSQVPDALYLWAKDLLVGHEEPDGSDPGFYQQHNRPFAADEFFELLHEAGFRRVGWRAINYGRPRFMGRRFLPESADLALSRGLMRATGFPGLRGLRRHARTHVIAAEPR